MDLLYFQSPPRFQFLHVLKSKVKGGESIFVDSFKIAEKMWKEERELWKVLTETKVGFHYDNDGKFYRFEHKTFEKSEEENLPEVGEVKGDRMPRLNAVNYSPPFQSPLPLNSKFLFRILILFLKKSVNCSSKPFKGLLN